MKTKRQIEIFSAGCQVCKDTVTLVNQLACPSCEVTILALNDTGVSSRAKLLGIRTIPAVVVDGQLAECCAERGPSERVLRAAGISTLLG
ncbi:MAG: thioredoxin family protein [Nitrospirales bacterium]|nr:thioredoxin family protein [Nitrospirales bacterium]